MKPAVICNIERIIISCGGAYNVLRDLNDVDVLDKKQEQLAEQIKNIVDSDEFPKDVPFDSGW